MKASVLGFMVFLCAFTTFAQDIETPAFLQGEKLDYEISWGFITAGNATLSVLPGRTSDEVEYRSRAWNNGFFESMYTVLDTVSTFVDKETLLPRLFRKRINEGGWHNHVGIDFSETPGSAHLTDSVFEEQAGKLKRYTDTVVQISPQTHSVTSAFYFIRTMDLKPGTSRTFQAVSGKKKYKLKVLVHRYETVEVEAGTFDCVVVEPVLDDDGLFEAKGKLTIWLTRDKKRIPVLVKSKILLGSIRVELVGQQ